MSTDTENGSLAMEAEAKRVDEKLEQIKTWAEDREIPSGAVVAAFGGPSGIEQPLPPNHTCVTWFDIHRPDGGKIHVVVRGGATRGSVLDVIFTASNVFGDLVEQGWMPADRRPRTEQEITETKAKLKEKLEPAGAKRKAKKAGDRQAVDSGNGEGTRTIEVKSILKRVTDTGNVNYLVKGHPWRKYGVTAWPDSGQIYKLDVAVDLEKWAIGELVTFDDLDVQAIVQLKEGGKPGKVIDFVGRDTLSDITEDLDDSAPPF